MRKPSSAIVATFGLVLAVDQISKSVVRHELSVCSAPPVSLCDRWSIAGPLGVLRTENGDGAFGLLPGGLIGPLLLLVIATLWVLARHLPDRPLVGIAAGLVLGGTVANLVDRAMFGVVTDFIDLRWGSADRGVVINPADVALAVGGVILALMIDRALRQPHQNAGLSIA